MATLAGVAYWPADTSEPVLELTTGDLLREAASDAGTQTALIEAAPDAGGVLGRLAEAVACAH